MIPEETIAEIKRRADLAGVIGRTVKLKKTGKNLVGLCPFHTEKSPSFNVSPDEGFYYCFGCKAAGDVVSFLEKTTGRGFLDIITELAEATGVELPKVELDPQEAARQAEKKRVLRALELAQVFFRTRYSSDEGKPARAYVVDVRKIDEASVDQFGLGFGGARDDGLVGFLKEQGVAVDDGVLAGVLGRAERNGETRYYDFFRHRVTVPIRNVRGQVVSFQGRIFGEREVAPDGTKRPKYVNGPQSPVYDKSRDMFGLFESSAALKKGGTGWEGAAVLVEGPLDAIAVHRAGVRAAVAPCGTGMTPRHVDEIANKTERVIVCLDADKAGKDAAARAMLLFLQRGLDVGLVALPDKDPDSLVQAGRADELRGLILGAPSALDALIAKAREKATGNMRARVQALDELMPFLAAPSRELVRAEAVRAVARAFNEDAAVIAGDVERRGRKLLGDRLRGVRHEPARAPPAALAAQPAATAPRPTKPRARPRPLSEAEHALLDALLTHPHLAARCGVLVPVLRHPELKAFLARLVEDLVRFHEDDPRALVRRIPVRRDGRLWDAIHALEQSGGFARPDAYIAESAAARVIEDAILLLDRRVLEIRVGELQAILAAADERGDHAERRRVLEEQGALVEALKALASPSLRPPPAIARSVEKVVAALPAPPEHVAPPGAAQHEPAPTPDGSAAEGPGAPDLPDGAPADDEAPPPEDAPWAGDPDDDPWAV